MKPKRAIIIERDAILGTPPGKSTGINALRNFNFMPGCINALTRIIRQMDFVPVMIILQDRKDGSSSRRKSQGLLHDLMMRILKNEGITFGECIPVSSSKGKEAGKGFAVLKRFLKNNAVDTAASCVIGSTLSILEVAEKTGCKALIIRTDDNREVLSEIKDGRALVAESWEYIVAYLGSTERSATLVRKTAETDVAVTLRLDGNGTGTVSTGLGFFDHLLSQIARHSGMYLDIKVKGDLHVDEHHTVEDTALVLGEAVYNALGSKRGIERYGFALPMDDSGAQVLLDFGGRNWLEWDVTFRRERVGDMPTELFFHFFKSFTDTARCNLHITARGRNEHHKIEAVFKAFARAMRMAIRKEPFLNTIPSTKEMI